MKAQYLLRFDDICPTMNWGNWERLENILREYEVKPILAVVPDNQDPHLSVAPPDPRFWDRVREWQTLGWTIGMHGWQHRFVTHNAGVVGVTCRSEFAGLPRKLQQEKLGAAAKIFGRQGIRSDLWIAPAHSFDYVTMRILAELGMHYISDGFSTWPFSDSLGLLWIPQQLWTFRYRPFGTWTICFHINSWTDANIPAFESNVLKYRACISTFAEVATRYRHRQKTIWDSLGASAYLHGSEAKNVFLRSSKSAYEFLTTHANSAARRLNYR